MAKSVDKLLIEIEANTKKLRQDLAKVKKELGQTEKKSEGLKKNLKAIGGALATIGAGVAIKGIVQTTRTFEDLEATLTAITGSASVAADSFDLIRQFTATTTFQLQNVSQAFITLLQAGIVPTSDTLKDFGNVAAAFGKDISDIAQATFRGITGEMEMLKQFNIIARIEGDKIKMTFDGVTTTIERNGQAVSDFIRNIGRTKFPTAIEDRANTLSGAISNLQDAFAEFQLAIGNEFKQTLTSLIRQLTRIMNAGRPVATLFGKVLNAALIAVGKPLLFFIENLKFIIGAALPFVLRGIAAGFMGLFGAISAAWGALTALNFQMLRFSRLSKASRFNVILAALGLLIVPLANATGLLDDMGDETEDLASLNERLAASLQKPLPFLQRLSFGLKESLETIKEFVKVNKDTDQKLRELMIFGGGDIAGVRSRVEEMFDEFKRGEIQTMKTTEQGRSALGLSNESRIVMRDGKEVEIFSTAIEDLGKYQETVKAIRESFFAGQFQMTETQFFQRLGLLPMGDVGQATKQLKSIIQKDLDPNQFFNDMLADHREGGSALVDFYQSSGGAAAFYGKTLEELIPIIEQAKLNNLELSDSASAMIQDIQRAEDPLKGLKEINDENKESFRDFFEEINAKFPQMFADYEDFITRYNAAIEEVDRTTKKAAVTFDTELRQAVINSSNAFTTDFVNSLLEGESALEAFRDFARNIISQIIAIFLQMAVVNKIINSAFNLEGTDNELATIDLASGGTAQRGKLHLVGERGPELFIPSTAGTIANNMNTKNMGGGSPIVINQSINLSTGVVATVRSEVMNMMPQISEATKTAVAESARRGGTYRKAFSG